MSKERINKFIFQDGAAFLRFKTNAIGLKLRKTDDHYTVEYMAAPDSTEPSRIPIQVSEDFNPHDYANAHSENHKWGSLLKTETHFYLCPKNHSFAVGFGPMDTNMGPSLIIDWPNVQWGFPAENKPPGL